MQILNMQYLGERNKTITLAVSCSFCR